MTRLPLLLLLTVTATACSASRAGVPSQPDIAEVHCHLRAGESLAPGIAPLSEDRWGPYTCQRALALYLDGHPQVRIGAVVPVARPMDPEAARGGVTDQGTQVVYVIYTTGAAPWPEARSLAVDEALCDRLADPATGDYVSGPPDCGRTLLDIAQMGRRVVVWFPIDEQNVASPVTPGTQRIVFLYERER